jgi:ABC-type phosphate transport system substrate-binding protein
MERTLIQLYKTISGDMTMRNRYVAAAVTAALALGASAVTLAAGPTPSAASGATHQIFIAGSSAAAAGIVSFLEANLCGGANFSAFTTPTSTVNLPDFRAVSCTAATGQPFAGTSVTVWYRAEGGSVVGVLPVINNVSVKQLDIVNASCAATDGVNYSCTGVTGSANVNGTNDTWGGGVLSHNIDIGISDLEPGVFGNTATAAGGGQHDPFGIYSAAFTGPDQTSSALQAMTHSTILMQTFGFVVNMNLGLADLPKEQITAIFDGRLTDWSKVSSAGGTAVGSGAIVVCHREKGSGTRASTDLFLNGIGCTSGASTINSTDSGTPADNFQTSAELDCVNTHPNSIGYVSIDNFSKLGAGKQFTAVNSITVSGVASAVQTSATGQYDYLFEASLNRNSHLSADATTLLTTMLPALQNVNSTSTSAQVTAIPGQPSTNLAQVPLQTGTHGVFTSQFLRNGAGGNSCKGLHHG